MVAPARAPAIPAVVSAQRLRAPREPAAGYTTLLVGGLPNIGGELRAKWARYGVRVAYQWVMDKPRSADSGIPVDVELVIIAIDMCSHGFSDTAKALARRQGIPYLAVERKLSSWAPAFARVGLVERSEPLAAPAATTKKREWFEDYEAPEPPGLPATIEPAAVAAPPPKEEEEMPVATRPETAPERPLSRSEAAKQNIARALAARGIKPWTPDEDAAIRAVVDSGSKPEEFFEDFYQLVGSRERKPTAIYERAKYNLGLTPPRGLNGIAVRTLADGSVTPLKRAGGRAPKRVMRAPAEFTIKTVATQPPALEETIGREASARTKLLGIIRWVAEGLRLGSLDTSAAAAHLERALEVK